jgi:hypothetical protein
MLRRAATLMEDVAADAPEARRATLLLGHALYHLAELQIDRGELAEAEEVYGKAVVQLRRAMTINPKPACCYQLRHAYLARADALSSLGQSERAERVLRDAVTVFEDLADDERAESLAPRLLPMIYGRLGRLLAEMGPDSEAEEAYSRQAETRERLVLDSPRDPRVSNSLAWSWVTSPYRALHEPARAVELATKVVKLQPENGTYWNTLGVALYRAGDWTGAIEALEKSMELRSGGDSYDWFFLAMAHWQLGEEEQDDAVRRRHQTEARRWYDKAVEWMEKNKPDDEELRRFHAEAAEGLVPGIPGSCRAADARFPTSEPSLHPAPLRLRECIAGGHAQAYRWHGAL